MKVPNTIKVDLVAETDPLIPALVSALKTAESVGWWKVCRNEAVAALTGSLLSDTEAREKALGWLKHSFVGAPDTAA